MPIERDDVFPTWASHGQRPRARRVRQTLNFTRSLVRTMPQGSWSCVVLISVARKMCAGGLFLAPHLPVASWPPEPIVSTQPARRAYLSCFWTCYGPDTRLFPIDSILMAVPRNPAPDAVSPRMTSGEWCKKDEFAVITGKIFMKR